MNQTSRRTLWVYNIIHPIHPRDAQRNPFPYSLSLSPVHNNNSGKNNLNRNPYTLPQGKSVVQWHYNIPIHDESNKSSWNENGNSFHLLFAQWFLSTSIHSYTSHLIQPGAHHHPCPVNGRLLSTRSQSVLPLSMIRDGQSRRRRRRRIC